MSLGSLLVGIAAALVTVAYVARPFRQRGGDWDRLVEQWVAQIEPPEAPVEPPPAPLPASTATADVEPFNFCPYCGRRVEPDHRFCPGCGKPLPGREVVA